MSRFGTGLGFNIQDIALISGIATEIFNTNVAHMTRTNHYESAGYDMDYMLNPFTTSVWFICRNTAIHNTVFYIAGDGGGRPFNFSVEGDGGLDVNFFDNATNNWNFVGARITTGAGTIIQDQLHKVTFVDDGVNQILYLDGVSKSSAPSKVIKTINSSLFRTDDHDSVNTNNDMLFLAVTKRAYSPAEVVEEYNGGVPQCYGLRSDDLKVSEHVFTDFAEWAGHTADKIVDRVGTLTWTQVGTVPYDGSAQIECEA